MKLTFEGAGIEELIAQLKSTLTVLSPGPLATTAVAEALAHGGEPEKRQTLGNLFDEEEAKIEATKPAKEKAKADPDRMAKMRAAKEAKKAEAEAAKKTEEPKPEPKKAPKEAVVEPPNPADVAAIRVKTTAELQAAYANGKHQEVLELLSRFGNGAKSFRELPPDAFLPIREAIDNGALT